MDVWGYLKYWGGGGQFSSHKQYFIIVLPSTLEVTLNFNISKIIF